MVDIIHRVWFSVRDEGVMLPAARFRLPGGRYSGTITWTMLSDGTSHRAQVTLDLPAEAVERIAYSVSEELIVPGILDITRDYAAGAVKEDVAHEKIAGTATPA